jgi:hypothetical protein
VVSTKEDVVLTRKEVIMMRKEVAKEWTSSVPEEPADLKNYSME